MSGLNISGVIGALAALGLGYWMLRGTIGWSEIRKSYAFNGSIKPIVARRYTTCWLNGIRGSYNLESNHDGLFISFSFPFNFMRPPVFVPWNDIGMHRDETLLIGRDVVALSFKKIPNNRFQIKSGVIKGILDSVGINLPEKDGT